MHNVLHCSALQFKLSLPECKQGYINETRCGRLEMDPILIPWPRKEKALLSITSNPSTKEMW